MSKFDPKLKKISGKTYIFDPLRKKFIFLTPEEWVRQFTIFLLSNEYGYSLNLMQSEKMHQLNKLNKRTDLLVYDRTGKPFLLIECKSENIKLNAASMNQALIYNKSINAPYIAITNGRNIICFDVANQKQLVSFPIFSEIFPEG